MPRTQANSQKNILLWWLLNSLTRYLEPSGQKRQININELLLAIEVETNKTEQAVPFVQMVPTDTKLKFIWQVKQLLT